jgi:hypothetical protein
MISHLLFALAVGCFRRGAAPAVRWRAGGRPEGQRPVMLEPAGDGLNADTPRPGAGVGERGAWASTSIGAPNTRLATNTRGDSSRPKPGALTSGRPHVVPRHRWRAASSAAEHPFEALQQVRQTPASSRPSAARRCQGPPAAPHGRTTGGVCHGAPFPPRPRRRGRERGLPPLSPRARRVHVPATRSCPHPGAA